MSGLKQCSKQSKTPYYISEIELNIYSLEEICYFLYNHIYLVEKSFFNEKLLNYIEYSLGKSLVSKKISELINTKASIEDIILTLFAETKYYEDLEIKKILPLLKNLETKGHHERMFMKAQNFYNNGKYEKSLNIYLNILMINYDYSLPREFYANVYYCIGVIYAKFFVYDKAEESFMGAYKICPKSVYLKNMVILCLIQEDEVHLLELIRKYDISNEVLFDSKKEYSSLIENVEKEFNAELRNK